ncbi:tetratricopeptide repeat protein [Pontibacter harenae]|uniref:tetratricopeptide repeat protein n=1 Tax=Pontibacter harenae TaxID=2894083 RepID=UPI001E46681F|nr:tetratricopeptide repeat protein [Pontibacter harenae]MCC9166038.1 tetratricopeptide repeat protein [Pontibacter harenae]
MSIFFSSKLGARLGATAVLLMLFCSAITIDGANSRLLKKAKKAMEQDDFAIAVVLLSEVLDQTPSNLNATFNLGYCYLELHQPEKAKLYLQQVYLQNPMLDEQLGFYLAEAHQQNYEFNEARALYQQELARVPKLNQFYISLLRKRMEECRAGVILMSEPAVADIHNAGEAINSSFSDYVPVLLGQDSVLLFTSKRPSAKNSKVGEEQVWVSKWEPGGWQLSSLFYTEKSSLKNHAVVSASPSGRELFLYAAEGGGKLYRAFIEGAGSWAKPELLGNPFNLGSKELSVHVTDDGRFAFFSSDRVGGYGGMDLYMCYKQADGTWSEALNLGPSVNTEFDEDAAFVDTKTNTLYFSSTGHNSIGGYDIFKSTIEGATWTQAENLGLPINSPFDDIYFVLAHDRSTAYFSSDRTGGFGAKDVYVAQ